MKYIQPIVYGKSFTCPHCGTLSKQDWWDTDWNMQTYAQQKDNAIKVGYCQHCEKNTLWVQDKMYFPENGNAPFPNP
jgi:transcription elongation factor Elf1